MNPRRIARRAYLTARHPGLRSERADERERRRTDLAVQARAWYVRNAHPVLVAVIEGDDSPAAGGAVVAAGGGATGRDANATVHEGGTASRGRVATHGAGHGRARRPGLRRDAAGATWRAARRTTAVGLTRVIVVGDIAAARAALWPGEDLVLLRAGVRPRPEWLAPLQLAAHQASGSVVGPRLLRADGALASVGVAWGADGPEHRWAGRPASWAPAAPLQTALALDGACLYVRADAVAELALSGTLDGAAEALCAQAWASGRRVLVAPASTVVADPAPPRAAAPGARHGDRIIYVTQDTGIGGGHRVIYTHLNGLAARGHEVELWTLAPEGPDWFDLHAPVRRFSDYPALAAALAPLNAVKVATWWETAPWVWEASRVHGVPVFWVQDIETTYYPTDLAAHADVLASYRPEFTYFTGCEWISDRLRELGLTNITTFTPGIDLNAVRPLPDVAREDDVVLALGRSQPLKDFPLTKATLQALDAATRIWLFGIEPDLAADLGARYIERPSDEEVNRLYNQATILLQTSKHEGFCLPVLEAMAAGAAVVTTDAHGNRDFCHDGENCLMPAERTPEALAAAIRRLLDDPALRARLATAGQETAAAFAWPDKLDQLDGHYRRLTAR